MCGGIVCGITATALGAALLLASSLVGYYVIPNIIETAIINVSTYSIFNHNIHLIGINFLFIIIKKKTFSLCCEIVFFCVSFILPTINNNSAV